MKQVIWSMVVVLLAVAVLAGTVLYTVTVMRAVQLQILTGERPVISHCEPQQ